jgi:phosphoenolpyruvate phosphomutase
MVEGSLMDRATAKRIALRAGLASDRPVVAVGAHDAISAALIERHGFDAVFVSGLGVTTAQHALPDLNLTTMTEVLEGAVRIDGATSLPVVADCDNGFGAFLNMLRTARQFERAGIAGIVIEDNAFPKRNSLLPSEVSRDLVPAGEQVRRIAAAKDAQDTAEFMLIARVESLIAGLGAADALERASAYIAAGADAIVIHSRDRTLAEIREFLEGWRSLDVRVPLVAIPTLYPTFTVEELRREGFSMVILANQLLRGAVRAMEDVLDALRAEQRAAAAEPFIVPVDHVFDLVGTRDAIRRDEAGS